jgi:hypothetical protein
MSSFCRLKIKTKYKMRNTKNIIVNNFKEKIKPKEVKPKPKPKIDYLARYKEYLGYILN